MPNPIGPYKDPYTNPIGPYIDPYANWIGPYINLPMPNRTEEAILEGSISEHLANQERILPSLLWDLI